MRSRTVSHLITTGLTLSLSAGAYAGGGVQTLSSDELVDTFIQDSAIVVSPSGERQAPTLDESRQRAIRALVMPGEPIVTEAEEEQMAWQQRNRRLESLADAQQVARDEFIRRSAISADDQLAALQPSIDTRLPLEPIPGYGMPEVPDAPFTKMANDQLGIAFDGDTLDFTIGNMPGIDNIEVPHGIDEGPVQLEPRAGGGFDLSIAVPD